MTQTDKTTRAVILEKTERHFPGQTDMHELVANVYDVAYWQALNDAADRIAALTVFGDTAASFAVFVRDLSKPSGDA